MNAPIVLYYISNKYGLNRWQINDKKKILRIPNSRQDYNLRMFDLMTELFKWDWDLFLQNIFLSIDTSTLRRCRQVSQVWKDFIDFGFLAAKG